MRRTVEPELMEDPAQAAAYAAADFAEGDAAFAAACLALAGPAAGPVIDLGCGPGNIALPLAQARPGWAVLAVDGAAAMLAEGRARCPALPNLVWMQASLPCQALPAAAFGLVVSNSLLHHLHDPQVLWAALRQVGRPGAAVCVGDLRRPADPAAAEALVARYAASAPAVLRQDFLASLHAAFEVSEVEDQLRQAGLSGLKVTAVGDRHLRVTGHLPG